MNGKTQVLNVSACKEQMVLMEGRYCTTELLGKLVIFSNKEFKIRGHRAKYYSLINSERDACVT
jgi:hypothetical protein